MRKKKAQIRHISSQTLEKQAKQAKYPLTKTRQRLKVKDGAVLRTRMNTGDSPF